MRSRQQQPGTCSWPANARAALPGFDLGNSPRDVDAGKSEAEAEMILTRPPTAPRRWRPAAGARAVVTAAFSISTPRRKSCGNSVRPGSSSARGSKAISGWMTPSWPGRWPRRWMTSPLFGALSSPCAGSCPPRCSAAGRPGTGQDRPGGRRAVLRGASNRAGARADAGGGGRAARGCELPSLAGPDAVDFLRPDGPLRRRPP